MKRLYYLDTLKAIAIIVVVFFHMGYMPYGYLGVDLFLVINGYLITRSLDRKIIEITPYGFGSYVSTYIQFIIDKLYRLLPVLLLASIFCLVWGYFVMLPDDYENLSQSIIATSLFSNNVLQAITTKDYWDVVNDYKPLMHTWYVGIIMQFYIVYPLLFLVSKNKKSEHRTSFVVLLSIMTFISFLCYLGTKEISDRFYYLPSRFFEFGVGGLIAMCYDTTKHGKLFSNNMAILLLTLIVCLFVIKIEFIPSNIKLILVVALSAGILLSQENLEYMFKRGRMLNSIFPLVGCMSYSIFVWHQVFLAFYRYSFNVEFTELSLILYLLLTLFISSLSYYYIEHGVNHFIKLEAKRGLSYAVVIVFIFVNSASLYVYKNGGVTRDVPELDIYKGKSHSGQHAEYCDRANRYNNEFSTNKPHWLIIGNSYGRDFVNIILESSLCDSVELSYSTEEYSLCDACDSRYKLADRVFISTLGVTPRFVNDVIIRCTANGLSADNVIVVGEKNFGENNGQIYWHRNDPEYYKMTTPMIDGFSERNFKLKKKYGKRFIDLIYYVKQENNRVRVFTDDYKYISSDCRHLTKAGAIFYAHKIPLAQYLK